MTFPAIALDTRVELQLGGTWTDVTAFCDGGPVQIGRGHPDESTVTSPSTMTVPLRNDDARFSALNPTGPYYGQIGRNTPVRVSIPSSMAGIPCYLRMETDNSSFASAPDSVPLQITTGTLSVRIDCKISDWRTANLFGKWGGTGRSWLLALAGPGPLSGGTGALTLFTFDGSSQWSVTSALSVPYFSGRIALRADYSIAAQTVTFYTAPTMAGSWTQLGPVVPIGATTLSGAAGQAVRVGAVNTSGFSGEVYEAQILSTASLVADPVFTSQTPGGTSFADAQSNTWTLNGTAELSGRLYRFHGEIPEWPQTWSPVSANVYVTATAAGLLRRLGRIRKPADSPMKRAYKRIPSSLNLAAYWPAEDLASATQIGQAAGTHAMTSAGLTMASFSGFACSSPLPIMNGASATAIVDPNSVTWTDNVIRFLLAIPVADDTNGAVICQFTTLGTIAVAQLVYTTGSNLTLNAYNAAGTLVFTNTTHFVNNPLVGRQVRVSVELLGSGNYNVWVLPPGGSATGFGSTFAGTIGGVTSVAFGGGLVTSAMGHFSVQGVSNSINDLGQPLNAWFGETAAARFARLCGEEGVTCRIIGPTDKSQPMGNQAQQTLAALVQECADADRGVWTETRQVLGWGYRVLRSLYNQPVGVPLSYSQNMLAYPLEETEDDQVINNDITASNASGSSSRTTLAAGPLSAAAPSQGGAGLYDTTVSVNIASDSMLIHQSGWSLHLGTVNEPRYPAVNLDLTETGPLAALLPQILLADLGDRFQIATPPGWLPPGPVDGLIQDWTETLDTRRLDIAWAAVPASPYNVAVLNDPVLGHLDTAGSQLNTGVNTTATSWSVATTLGPLWTTDPAQFPFDWKITGEVVTVTLITGASSPQTATVTRSVNGVVKSHLAGEAISLAHPMILQL